jgi:hypothetical protein
VTLWQTKNLAPPAILIKKLYFSANVVTADNDNDFCFCVLDDNSSGNK